jgi:dihydrofolate reductase
MLTIIAAAAENNALGKDNQLVWHLPDDFKRFKSLTSGHYIIMDEKPLKVFRNHYPIVRT